MSETILEEAARITSGPRERDYDHPYPNHERIARLWQSYMECRKDQHGPITPEDVAQMMILLKIARQVYTPKRDNLVDICGYARCLERMAEYEAKAAPAEPEWPKWMMLDQWYEDDSDIYRLRKFDSAKDEAWSFASNGETNPGRKCPHGGRTGKLKDYADDDDDYTCGHLISAAEAQAIIDAAKG